jgi:hypothetical protein
LISVCEVQASQKIGGHEKENAMVAQIGRFNVIAAALAAACLILWAWQVRPRPVSETHYTFALAMRPLPPDARTGPHKTDHNSVGPNSEDSFQGEVVSPDGGDQDSHGSDNGDDDEMNPEDQVYPI